MHEVIRQNLKAWRLVGVAMSVVLLTSGMAGASSGKPIVIAHRGASGYVPEHTLDAYRLAVEQGADYIEPDLVMTKDGVLIARHENEIGGTTNVAEHVAFAERRTTKRIDGASISGWFTEDFTLAELKTLRARERIPRLRPGNSRFDGRFKIPTLEEVLSLVRALDRERAAAAKEAGQPGPAWIGVYPETKHPSYFTGLRLPMEELLLRTLAQHGYRGRTAPVFIQSFEVGNLRELRRKTKIRLVQLIEASGAPYDLVARGEDRTYADLVTRPGLREIATYADAIGVNKGLIIPRAGDGSLAQPTALVANAHAEGLMVHGWTFRAENDFLPSDLRSSADPAGIGDLAVEVVAFLATGMDGFFTDQPDIGVRARDMATASHAGQ
jgi:glycerophosphoryl diester phosphodiesterase